MKRISAYKHFVLALLAAGLLLAVSGCAWVRDDDADVFLPEGSNFRMSLTVLAPSSAPTRAGNHADDGQEDGTAAENYIDFQDGDFRIALFGKTASICLPSICRKNGPFTRMRPAETMPFIRWSARLNFRNLYRRKQLNS